MSSDALHSERWVLRIALATSVGLTVNTLAGSSLPGLAVLLALKMLLAPKRPSLWDGIVLIVVALATTEIVHTVALALGDQEAALVVFFILAYTAGFAFQTRMAMPGLIFLITLTLVPIWTEELRSGDHLYMSIAIAIPTALALAWLTDLLLPLPPQSSNGKAPRPPPAPPGWDLISAGAKALFVMPAFVLYLSSPSSFSMAGMTTLVVIFSLPETGNPRRLLFDRTLGNLMAGLGALAAFIVIYICWQPAVLFLVSLFVSLIMARTLAARTSGALTLAITVFVQLLGLSVSQRLGGSPVDLTQRLVDIVGVGFYAVGATYLIAAGRKKWLRPQGTHEVPVPAPLGPGSGPPSRHPSTRHSRVKALAASAGRGVLVGVGSGAVLLLTMAVAEGLREVLWSKLPPAFGATEATWWWIVVVLTLTGLAVGLIVRYVPGHAGPDPATEDLFAPPLPLLVLPGLALAFVLMSAGGVSLGPEGPAIGIAVALAVSLGARAMPGVEATSWQMLAVAGTIGAAFGTPVAAALIFSEILSDRKDKPFWDQMFAPLAAAGAGSLTMIVFHQPNFTLALPAYQFSAIDLLSGPLITLVAVAVAAGAVWMFPLSHRLFHSIRSPVLMVGLGGLVLGALGAIGGATSLFNGQHEIHVLTANAPHLSIAALLGFVVVKTTALVVAATCGFNGGRIFPSVFAGVAIGPTVSKLLPGVPVSLAIACAVLGFTLVVSRNGWLSLFMGGVVVPDVDVVPLLCVAILPAWLVAVSIPEMRIVHLRPASGDGHATEPDKQRI